MRTETHNPAVHIIGSFARKHKSKGFTGLAAWKFPDPCVIGLWVGPCLAAVGRTVLEVGVSEGTA
jgi:hypothetical protein